MLRSCGIQDIPVCVLRRGRRTPRTGGSCRGAVAGKRSNTRSVRVEHPGGVADGRLPSPATLDHVEVLCEGETEGKRPTLRHHGNDKGLSEALQVDTDAANAILRDGGGESWAAALRSGYSYKGKECG